MRLPQATLLMIAALSAPALASEPSQRAADNKRIVSEAFDRWAAGGSGFFNDILDENVVWRIEGSSPTAREYRGREVFVAQAVRPFATRMADPLRPTDVNVWSDGDHVIAQWRGSGVARDGQAYQNSYAWIMRMENGKAAEVTAFLDLAPYDELLSRVPAASQ